MENFAYFTLKEEYKRLHSVGDKLVEIDSLRIGNLIISFLSPYFFYKTSYCGRLEADVIFMF